MKRLIVAALAVILVIAGIEEGSLWMVLSGVFILLEVLAICFFLGLAKKHA